MKQSNIITQQPKTLENPNIIDIKSVTIEHLKTSNKLSKTIRQAEKVSQVGGAGKNCSSSVYSEPTKSETFLDEKSVKIMKWSHAHIGYARTNVEILNSFNHELQLKDTEFAMKNKLIDLLTELRGFKFVKTLVLEFKKIENDDKTKYSTFYLNSKAEILMKVTLMMNLNQYIVLLY